MFSIARVVRCTLQQKFANVSLQDVRALSLTSRLGETVASGSGSQDKQSKIVPASASASSKSSRPLSPYMQFFLEKLPQARAQNPGKRHLDIVKLVSAEYKQLPSADRDQRKQAYASAMKTFLEIKGTKPAAPPLTPADRIARNQRRRQLIKRRINIVQKKLGLKTRHSRNALSIYVSEMFKQQPPTGTGVEKRKNVLATFSEASRRFKSLSPAERDRLKQLAINTNNSTKAAYEAWLAQLTKDAKSASTGAERKTLINHYFALRDRLKSLAEREKTLKSKLHSPTGPKKVKKAAKKKAVAKKKVKTTRRGVKAKAKASPKKAKKVTKVTTKKSTKKVAKRGSASKRSATKKSKTQTKKKEDASSSDSD